MWQVGYCKLLKDPPISNGFHSAFTILTWYWMLSQILTQVNVSKCLKPGNIVVLYWKCMVDNTWQCQANVIKINITRAGDKNKRFNLFGTYEKTMCDNQNLFKPSNNHDILLVQSLTLTQRHLAGLIWKLQNDGITLNWEIGAVSQIAFSIFCASNNMDFRRERTNQYEMFQVSSQPCLNQGMSWVGKEKILFTY